MLKDLLKSLKNGARITLDTTVNQFGDEVAIETLEFENGRWWVGSINCWNASDFGLGTCRCVSHKSWHIRRVTHDEALKLLKEYIERQEQDKAARMREIQWLEEAIKDTENVT